MESFSSSNDVSKQVESLDDADVWKQQLITFIADANALTHPSNGDCDNTACVTNSANDPKQPVLGKSSTKEDMLSIMNQIGNGLHDLECFLRCYHCAGLFHAPVMVEPCLHIFCSYCIRNKFHYDRNISTIRKASCSLCKCIVDASRIHHQQCCLRPHHTLDLFVYTFRQIRQPLLSALREEQQRILSSSEFEAKRVSQVHLPNTLCAVKNAVIFLERITKPTKNDIGKPIERTNIQNIVKQLLLNAGNLPYPELTYSLLTPRPRLSGVIYNGKTKKQLIELCTEVGISTHGISNDESALKKRHFDFIALYNAECDSLRPRSHEELLHLLAQQQSNIQSFMQPKSRCLSKTSLKGSSDVQINPHRNGGNIDYVACMNALKLQRKRLGESPYPKKYWSAVTTGYSEFDREVEENFQKLISDYYARFPDQLQKQTERIKRYKDGCRATDTTQRNASITPTSDRSSGSVATTQKSLQPASFVEPSSSIPQSVDQSKNQLDQISEEKITQSSAFEHPVIPKRSSIGFSSTGKQNTIRSILLRGAYPTNEYDQNDLEMNVEPADVTVDSHHGDPTETIHQSTSINGIGSKHPSPQIATSVAKKVKKSSTFFKPTRNQAAKGTIVVDTSSLIGPWICTYCTYCNTKDRSTRARCEICSNVRVPPGDKQASSPTGNVIEIDC